MTPEAREALDTLRLGDRCVRGTPNTCIDLGAAVPCKPCLRRERALAAVEAELERLEEAEDNAKANYSLFLKTQRIARLTEARVEELEAALRERDLDERAGAERES